MLLIPFLKASDTLVGAACTGDDPAHYEEEKHHRFLKRDHPRLSLGLANCAKCPVMTECGEIALRNKETGVWGGMYLIRGRPHRLR